MGTVCVFPWGNYHTADKGLGNDPDTENRGILTEISKTACA